MVGIPVIAMISAAALVVGYLARRRIRSAIRGRTPVVTDEVLKTILSEGALEALGDGDEEPLDDDAIRAAEDEFWAEDWGDDPEGWRG